LLSLRKPPALISKDPPAFKPKTASNSLELLESLELVVLASVLLEEL